jgi:DNA-binding NtrC family response regulator
MVAKPRILVVDDEPVVRESIHDWFSQDDYPIEMAADGPAAMQKIQESHWDILLTDVKMPGMDGLELQQRVKKIDPEVTVIIMTAYASVDSAMQAIKEGAYDYVTKPLDPEDLQRIIDRVCEHRQLVRENVELKQRIEAVTGEPDEIVGDSPEIRKVREQITTLAAGDASVLIIGEGGTDKELVARSIHRASPRQNMPLVTVKCSKPSAAGVAREFFGCEAGALPGADYPQKGRLELAHRGTAFFEEIGELGLKAQDDLLRALEAKSIRRVGGSELVPADFRCIAATQRDLAEAVERGTFRRDLYEQISACRITLPPLRNRRADIEPLACHFLERAAGETGSRASRISATALQLLKSYDWPGNVRELRNIIERAAVLQTGDEILPGDLPLAAPVEAPPAGALPLAEVEKQYIRTVLTQVSGDLSEAARALQIDEATLGALLRKHGLEASQP